MLHPESGEHFQMPVVHLHRDVDRDFAVGIAQHPPQAFIQVELLCGQVKARALRLPRIGFLIHVRGGGDGRH